MFANQPHLVRELQRKGQLRQHLEAKMQQALRLVDRSKERRGLSEDEAFETAMQSILAPPDGPAMSDVPPEPVPWARQERFLSALTDKD